MFVNLSHSSAVNFDNAISIVYHHIDSYFKLMPTNFLSVIINMWMSAMNEQGCGSSLCLFISYVLCLVSPRSVSNGLTCRRQITLTALRMDRMSIPLSKYLEYRNFRRPTRNYSNTYLLQIKFNRKNIVAGWNQQLDYKFGRFFYFYFLSISQS